MRDKVLFGACPINTHPKPPPLSLEGRKMQVGYAQVRKHAPDVAAAIAAARSALNLRPRQRVSQAREDRTLERQTRSKRRKSDRELERLLNRRVRVQVEPKDRPRIRDNTARKLYHRALGMLPGTIGHSDARGPDRHYSLHFGFVARGFASTAGRRWRTGEAERAARYIVREDGIEAGKHGWWSNIATNRAELTAFFRTLEAVERHDRKNANVYCTEVIALSAELTSRQRRLAVKRISRFFQKRGLAYVAAVHVPDAAGDQRNFHCHIIYSLRPAQRHDVYDWSFALSKENDINTPAGIRSRRQEVVRAINKTLSAAGKVKRYTALSNKARKMAAGQPKLGRESTWITRRLAATETRVAALRDMKTMITSMCGALADIQSRQARQHAIGAERLDNLYRRVVRRPTVSDTQNRIAATLRSLRGRADRLPGQFGARVDRFAVLRRGSKARFTARSTAFVGATAERQIRLAALMSNRARISPMVATRDRLKGAMAIRQAKLGCLALTARTRLRAIGAEVQPWFGRFKELNLQMAGLHAIAKIRRERALTVQRDSITLASGKRATHVASLCATTGAALRRGKDSLAKRSEEIAARLAIAAQSHPASPSTSAVDTRPRAHVPAVSPQGAPSPTAVHDIGSSVRGHPARADTAAPLISKPHGIIARTPDSERVREIVRARATKMAAARSVADQPTVALASPPDSKPDEPVAGDVRENRTRVLRRQRFWSARCSDCATAAPRSPEPPKGCSM